MGYYTDYYGEIKIRNKKIIPIIRKMMNKEEEPFGFDGIEIRKGNTFFAFCNWKDSGDFMLKICLFISKLDKTCSGEIKCNGEENEDIWKIVIKDGEVHTKQGIVAYNTDKMFDNKKIKKQVYEITKDKDLLKEVILDELGGD